MIDDLRFRHTDPRAAWKSLSELADPKTFRDQARDEFSSGASTLDPLSRRDFLKWMGASLALAGLPACTRQPLEKIVPYVKQPEELVPGRPLFFATAITWNGFATGLVVESHEGHPTKIEGNPRHPASLGATHVFHQAALLDLYDPDRSQTVLQNGRPDTWENFIAALTTALSQTQNGRGLRLLTETVTSPTLHSQIRHVLEKFPEARWHQFEPVNRDNVHDGARLAFGEVLAAQYHFDKARVIVSLDSDFLYAHPNSVRHARDFAARRRARSSPVEMSRLYVVESSPTITGANADHRLPLRFSEIEPFARALAQQVGATSRSATENPPSPLGNWLSALGDDLQQNHGHSLVLAGENQPPIVHALAHRMNDLLGNLGNTLQLTGSAEAMPANQIASLRELVEALDRGQVDVLLVLGGNPAFTAPADLAFAQRSARAKFTAHLSPDRNETSALCRWHIPQNHFLESWSDARAFDGTVSIVQPLILPLYAGRSAHEILDAMLSPAARSDYDIVRAFWQQQNPGDDFEDRWRQALRDGFVTGTASAEKTVSTKPIELAAAQPADRGPEVTFRPDPTIFDGRFANNGWLQELPRPITKLVWDNAALVSPAFAEREKLSNGDLIDLAVGDREIRSPVWITPGQSDDSIALSFGNGRILAGHVGSHAGFNVYPLRTSNNPWSAPVTWRKTGEKHPLVTTQTQHTIDSEERQIFREGTFDEFRRHPDLVTRTSISPSPAETLFAPPAFPSAGHRWGMTIDLSACIGCAACTLACQVENNIPVVGKAQVAAGRIMHWIRVDTYFRGTPSRPDVTHQPVPCMHCENAPCEVVCPVGATVHDREGLNLQVYNRCVGTRYCSNNCPYKVRRFNFLQYADEKTPSLQPRWNPNVTVRSRGVMEKCTYCVQRIARARIQAEEENRPIRDGELSTACQQVCPADAIVFGDLNDPASRVARSQNHPLNFLMLGQLNTRPRTTYLAKLRNPNPKLS